MPFIIIIAAVVLIILFKLALHRRRVRRRHLLISRPFPPEWRSLLEKECALYKVLSVPLRDELHRLICVFLNEKKFEGCQGLSVTEEMKVLIAAQACLLLVNNDRREREELYPSLSTILIYHGAYVSPEQVAVGRYQVLETTQARLGESWNRGEVVLAWDHVKSEAGGDGSGENVVLHEFAHQLDQEDGSSDGAPLLRTGGQYSAWARILGGEYQRLQEDLARNHPTLLRDYAASNPAEFFAVATEVFFEQPARMKRMHPALYGQLRDYYGLDPERWIEAAIAGRVLKCSG